MMNEKEPVVVVVRNDRLVEAPLFSLVPDVRAECERTANPGIVGRVTQFLHRVWPG